MQVFQTVKAVTNPREDLKLLAQGEQVGVGVAEVAAAEMEVPLQVAAQAALPCALPEQDA